MNNNEVLSIKGTLSLEDFKMYNSFHLKKAMTIYFIICFIVLFSIIQLPMSGDLFLVFIFAGIPSLIISSLLVLFVKTVNKRRAIKEYNSDQLIKNETTYTISKDGINQKIRRSNNHFEWNDIRVANELDKMFLLYISKYKAIVLPKSFFVTNKEINLFKKIVANNTKTSKVKFN